MVHVFYFLTKDIKTNIIPFRRARNNFVECDKNGSLTVTYLYM